MSARRYLLTTTALASFGAVWLVASSFAADMATKAPPALPTGAGWAPAVSGINFKIDGYGGWLDEKGGIPERNRSGDLGGADASLTVPLGDRFGLQVDGSGGSWGGESFWGAGGHAFWRDPNTAMLGMIGSWMRLDRGPWPFIGQGKGIAGTWLGGEGEYYLNAVTLRAAAGWEGGDLPSGGFVRADARWYPQNDLMLSAGYRYTANSNALALGGEWLTPTNVFGGRVALFAEGRIGQNNYNAAIGGLRIYFGKSQTLIDKHRRDDPDGDTVDNLFAIQHRANHLDQLNKAVENTLTSCTSCSATSDMRLKRDIALLARLDDGIGIYRYRYIWDDTVYVGVMAQEVMAVVPEAIQVDDNGYLRVDYSRLGLRLMTWNEWTSLLPRSELQAAA
jgi:hypothetical protein